MGEIFMSAQSFKSNLNQDEMDQAWEDFIKKEKKEREYLESYVIKKREEAATRFFIYLAEDARDVHCASDLLAEFVSTVIAPDSYCIIEFGGDAGEKWGFAILKGEVHEITYPRYVGDKSLKDFLESKKVNGIM